MGTGGRSEDAVEEPELMRIALGQFARKGLEAHLGDLGVGVNTALGRLLEREAQREPSADPGIPLLPPLRPRTVDLTVPPELEPRITAEAARRGATVEELTSEAIVSYLVELDRAETGDRPSAPDPLD